MEKNGQMRGDGVCPDGWKDSVKDIALLDSLECLAGLGITIPL